MADADVDTGSAKSDASDGADQGDAQVINVDAGQPWGCMKVVADNILSSNATTIQSYSTNVNVSSFRQHGLLYYGGYQFVAWYNGLARNVIVARRSLDASSLAGGPWQWAYVNFTLASSGDSHNVITMAVSPADGRLHVAIGQHGAPLYYIHTKANAVSAAVWDNIAFGGTGSSAATAAAPLVGLPGVATALTSTATYPYYMSATNAARTLQLAYRTGASGNGEMQLAEYDPTSGNWTSIGQFTASTGSYAQNGLTSTTRNDYPHGFNYDGNGRLHMAFTWREGTNTVPSCAGTANIGNHDTLYAYSDDLGRTWMNNSGVNVATTGTSSIALGSPGIVVDSVPTDRDLMNQETQLTDHRNLFHVVVSYVPAPYQPGCATDRTQAQPFHLWRAANGTWTKTQIQLNGQDVNQGYDRSKAFVDSSDNLYVILPDLRVVGASAATQWTNWRLLYDGRGLSNYGETIIDYLLTQTTNGVSVLYQKSTTASTGELHVLDLQVCQ